MSSQFLTLLLEEKDRTSKRTNKELALITTVDVTTRSMENPPIPGTKTQLVFDLVEEPPHEIT